MYISKFTGLFLFLLNCSMQLCQGADVLFLAPLGSKSHTNFYYGIIYGLAEKGHKVTMVSSFDLPKKDPNIEIITLRGFEIEKYMPNVFKDTGIWPIVRLIEETPQLCASSMKTKEVQELFKRKFDLVIVTLFMSDCYFYLAHYLQVPFISVFPAGLFSGISHTLGNPTFPSFNPDLVSGLTPPLSLFDRFKSVMISIGMNFAANNFMASRFDSACRKSGACPADMPFIGDIKSNSSAGIINSVRTMETSVQPYMPNIIHAGAMHCRPAMELPQDLKKWADESGDSGFIYFSLGSATKPADMPERHRKTLLQAFSSLKQRVLWKWHEEHMDGLTDNVKLGKWLPQQDILGHPNLKLFITHGGLNSIHEAIYHGVNIIGLPIFADQFVNIKDAENQGWGKQLNWEDMTPDKLKELIEVVIDNNQMKSQVKKRSALMLDQIRPAKDDVVYWIEYIIRHNGAEHLKSPILQLTWYEMYNIDVYICIFSILMVIAVIDLLLLKYCCKCIYRKCCGSKKKKRE